MIDPASFVLVAFLVAFLAAAIVGCTWIAMIGRLTGWWRLFRLSRRQRREGEV